MATDRDASLGLLAAVLLWLMIVVVGIEPLCFVNNPGWKQ